MNKPGAGNLLKICIGALALTVLSGAVTALQAAIKFGHVGPPFHRQSKGGEL